MDATYLIDWRCEGCRETGTHLLAMELTGPEWHQVTGFHHLLYVGGAMPKRIVELYDAELCNVEAEHAQATGCHGRICGEGGAIVRGKPLRQASSDDDVQALETRHRPAKSRWWNPASWLWGKSAGRDGETDRIIATVSSRLHPMDDHDELEELFKWP